VADTIFLNFSLAVMTETTTWRPRSQGWCGLGLESWPPRPRPIHTKTVSRQDQGKTLSRDLQ